jgi:hypothetical protein
MVEKYKILNSAKFLASVCGGWWSAMSGATSIPFAFIALFLRGNERKLFTLLAFCALWVFAIRVAWKNYHSMESAARKQKMKEDLTASFIELGKRRQLIQGEDCVKYDDRRAEGKVDQESMDVIAKAGDCVRQYLGKPEYDIFMSNAGFPKIPDSERYRFYHGQIQALEQREIRLRQLIEKRT